MGEAGAVLPPAARRERAVQLWAHALASQPELPCEVQLRSQELMVTDGAHIVQPEDGQDQILAVSGRQERVLFACRGVVETTGIKKLKVSLDEETVLALIGANAKESR